MAGVRRRRSDNRDRSLAGLLKEALNTSPRRARDRRSKREKSTSARRSTRKRTHQVQSASNQPPVLVRRMQRDMATPLRQASKPNAKNPRRRFDLTLNVPGAEVRLPSMPAVRFSWRIASGLLVVMMGLALYMLLYAPAFQVDLLEVDGMQRLTVDDLMLVFEGTGEPVVNMDPDQIRQDLLDQFVDIKDVRVWVNLPALVRLEIQERQPVIAWKRGDETVWVDDEGMVFPQRGEFSGSLLNVKAKSLPLVAPAETPEDIEGTGELVRERLDPEMVSVLLSMSQYMPEGARMVFDPEYGFGWHDDRGWNIYFGSQMEEIDQKLGIYQAVVDRLQADGIQPALISLEFLHAPFYRMER